MKQILVQGVGVVSAAGWGMQPFRAALEAAIPLPVSSLKRPGWTRPLGVRQVPSPLMRPGFLAHPRLRRSSPISQYSVGAALEALGDDHQAERTTATSRLGIVFCVMSGCVNYSRRFYDEVLRNPATASPLVFPETVFNAPSSHLAALLGTSGINYTLVGDPGVFIEGLGLACDWITTGQVEGCLVIGAEEMDWLTADAFRLFSRNLVIGDGAGALYLRAAEEGTPGVRVDAISDTFLFSDRKTRASAVRAAAAQAAATHGEGADLLCDSLQGVPWLDRDEEQAWQGWTGRRLSPRRIFGEGLMASAAWQCVAAVDQIARGVHHRAIVPVSGINQHVGWARFVRNS